MTAQRQCIECKKIYTTSLTGRDDPRWDIAAPWEREQHISGICSDRCWADVFRCPHGIYPPDDCSTCEARENEEIASQLAREGEGE